MSVGLGDGADDCHDVANLPLLYISGGENSALFSRVFFYVCTLLGVLVAKREPTTCYNDENSVGTPKWATHGKTTFSPTGWRVLLVSKRIFVYLWVCW